MAEDLVGKERKTVSDYQSKVPLTSVIRTTGDV